ncbi:MAG: HEAT repeat domain-containing protein [Candidatus Zhuqueibacterota bacterium]
MKTMKNLVLTAVLALALVSFAAAQTQPLNDKEYDQYLINSLQDENAGIRTSAAQLLGERKVENAVDPLIQLMRSDKCHSVRIIAALALYKIGDKRALPDIKNLAKTDTYRCVRVVATGIVMKMESVEYAQR